MIWQAIIIACFVYIGVSWLINNVVVGTATSDVVIRTAVPLVFAVAFIGILPQVFRGK